MSYSLFPPQDIPQIQKTPDWAKKCVNYGLSLLDYQDGYKQQDSELYRSYNGERSVASTEWITKLYGKESRAKFVSYKVGRAKQYLLEGEWLKRPLNASVQTINSQAKSEKMEQMDLMVGAMIAKQELSALKNVAGVDVMEGAQVPENQDDPIWAKMSAKDKQEDIMQVIANEQIRNLRLIKKFSDLFRDARIVAKCFAKVEINQDGDVDFTRIDPRDAIYEEIDNDDFLEKSVVKGARQSMPLHQVLIRYELTKEDRAKLEQVRQNPSSYINNDRRYRMRLVNQQIMVDVIHVEWKSVMPVYYKIMPKTPNQLDFDDTTSEITKEIPPEIYEANKAKYDRGEANGEFKIVTKYKEDLWEGTCLGGIIYVDMRRKQFQMRRFDAPNKIMDSSYIGCLFGTTDGMRISLQKLIENFDLAFDVCEYQIMKELNRAKGKVVFMDLAALPKNKTYTKVLQEMLDDGVSTYNSMAAGNVGNRNLELANAIKELDLGFSSSFPQLIALQNNILNTLDRITGINENREGMVSASATVSNTNSAINASRTITEPLFYQMQLFVEKAMTIIIEATKISWAFYKLDKGEQILGTDNFKFMQITRELGMRDFGVHVEDGGRYIKLKERMTSFMEFGLNGKQIEMADALRFELSETIVEAEQVFENALQRVRDIAIQSQQSQQEAAAQQNQQTLQTQIQIAQENREDNQVAKINEIVVAGEVQKDIDNNKTVAKMTETQQKDENKMLNNEI